jgi:hypothetical protein
VAFGGSRCKHLNGGDESIQAFGMCPTPLFHRIFMRQLRMRRGRPNAA